MPARVVVDIVLVDDESRRGASHDNLRGGTDVFREMPPLLLLLLCALPPPTRPTPFVVQSLSSRYAVLLGGYGPGYSELREVEVVRHDRVCQGAVSDVPTDPARFLGDVSGMAESVDDAVIFCRHSKCWRLDVKENKWSQVGGLHIPRERAASVAVGSTMLVLGGLSRSSTPGALMSVEEYDAAADEWVDRPDWAMAEARYSFCAAPLNDTAFMVAGGYIDRRPPTNSESRKKSKFRQKSNNSSGGGEALSSVHVFDMSSGRWERAADLPTARYGHACLLMEWEGRAGVLAVGGALTPTDAVFLDLSTGEWTPFAPLPYSVDGHRAALVEGIPVVFSWRRALAFDGHEWVEVPELAPQRSRSAFAVAEVPGHLIRGCG